MARNKRDIAFGTMNLYNLQSPGKPMYPRSTPYTQEEYEEKIAWTAELLKGLEADVIAFQELWAPECLVDLFEKAGLAQTYELAFIKDGGWDGIAVAAAVRKPWAIAGSVRHKDFPAGFKLKKRDRTMREIINEPTEVDLLDDESLLPNHEDDDISVSISRFSRSALQVSVRHSEVDDVPEIQVFCTHLKSKLPTRIDLEEFRDDRIKPHRDALGAALSTIRRTAEAAALRVILNETMKDNDVPVVVLGDLNDGQFSNTLGILSDQPSYRLYADSRTARRNDDGLFTAVNMQQLRSLKDYLYTHEFKGIREVIDHVMVSEQFYDHANGRLWAFREMHVLNDHIGHKEGRIKSDHAFLQARFDWLPA